MAKKTKRYAAGDEIVVSGRRSADQDAASDFMLQNMIRNSGGGGGSFGGGMGGMDGGGGGGGGRGSITPTPLPAPARSMGPRITPTAISQPRSTLGQLSGTAAPKGYGIKLTKRFKKGGSVSSASKRADGCATKGKTKGKMV